MEGLNPFEDPELTYTTNRSFCSRWRGYFRSYDQFGIPIVLKYKGAGSFKTNYGCAYTLVIVVILIYTLINSVVAIVNNNIIANNTTIKL